MKGSFRDFCIGVCGSLFATFILTIGSFFIKIDPSSTFIEYLIRTIVELKFVMYWVLFWLGVMLLRWVIRNRIDKLQASYPSAFSISYYHEIDHPVEAYDMKWNIKGNVKQRERHTNEVQSIIVDYVEGAFCKHDFRKMKETRTFFGRYKNKCPKCGYTVYSVLNNYSMEKEIADEAESQVRNSVYNKKSANS
ncbi:hypothetical protein [Niallia taxi]|uniref:hypothetical protein n=1 Tax=Niallia taxi TaxID=2499688 RepID=UPI0015F62AD3|nr:hypothetical protein [Niallia taxi]